MVQCSQTQTSATGVENDLSRKATATDILNEEKAAAVEEQCVDPLAGGGGDVPTILCLAKTHLLLQFASDLTEPGHAGIGGHAGRRLACASRVCKHIANPQRTAIGPGATQSTPTRSRSVAAKIQ